MIGLLGIARCSQGYLGIVLREGVKVEYPDGTTGVAYTGRHLPKVWRRWSSRSPVWITQR